MTRHLFVPIACVLSLAACSTDPNDPFTSLTSAASLATTNNMEEDESGDGDGDGDPDTGDGDGDGDPTTGDGDGDGDEGDGDGDEGDGDGDGDGDEGDGDGDQQMSCGWNAGGSPAGYYCGFMGEDPGGTPIECPPGLVDGADCGEITGAGCCDANGDNWYCGEDGEGNLFLVLEACP
jgi:hypothetical protein